MIENTNDLSKFGYIEMVEASKLLKAYVGNMGILDDGVKIEFNPNSGMVFLVDENFNVVMMNGDKLEKWYNCPYCGHEGFLEDMKHDPENQDCADYLKEIGIVKEESD